MNEVPHVSALAWWLIPIGATVLAVLLGPLFWGVVQLGGGDVITMDTAYMDVDVWAASLDAADTLAAQVASWMRLYLPGHSATVTSGTGTFAACRSQTGMMQRPSGNPDVKRVGGAFTVTVHSA